MITKWMDSFWAAGFHVHTLHEDTHACAICGDVASYEISRPGEDGPAHKVCPAHVLGPFPE